MAVKHQSRSVLCICKFWLRQICEYLGQGQGQGQDQAQGHLQLQQRAALPHLLMALSLVLALTLVLALVRNIIFSKVRVLVLNQPIILLLHSMKRNGPAWPGRPPKGPQGRMN